MKFYILYVKTRRFQVEVGGWDFNSDERREERERRIDEQIIMPSPVRVTQASMEVPITNRPGVPYAQLTERGRRRAAYTMTAHLTSGGEAYFRDLVFRAMLQKNAETLKEDRGK